MQDRDRAVAGAQLLDLKHIATCPGRSARTRGSCWMFVHHVLDENAALVEHGDDRVPAAG